MRTKRKLLVSILSGIACLATAFAFVCAPKASKTVSAESLDSSIFTTREYYDYVQNGGNVIFEPEDGELYVRNNPMQGPVTLNVNPWEKTIRTKISVTETGHPGLQFFAGAQGYTVPGISLLGTWQKTLTMYNSWDTSVANGHKIEVKCNKALSLGTVYSVEYGFANEMTGDAISAYLMYFKMTDMSGAEIVNHTGRVAVRKDASGNTIDYSKVTTSSTIGGAFSTDAFGFCYPFESGWTIDSLESDEDISYYWNRANNKPIVVTEKYRTTPSYDPAYEWLCGDTLEERFLAPGYNTRMTFRFKGDPNYTSGKYCFLLGFRNEAYAWDSSAFTLDFANKKLTVGNGPVGIAQHSSETTWAGDISKEYDVSLSVRKVNSGATDHGDFVIQMDVTEVGTTTTTKVGAWIPVKTELVTDDVNKYYNRFEVFSGNVNASDATLKCTISAVNPYWNATVVDGENSTTTKARSFTLPAPAGVEGKDFIGWVSGDNTYKAGDEIALTEDTTFTATYGNVYNVTVVDGETSTTNAVDSSFTLPAPAGVEGKTFIGWVSGNEFYKAGDEIALTEDVTFTAQYVQFGTIEVAAIRVDSVQTGIRFKGYVNTADWTALTAIDPNAEIFMVVEREDGKQVKIAVTADNLYDVEGETEYKEFAVTVGITAEDTDYYSTVYAAKTFVSVTYEGDEKATYVTTNEMAKNSVANIATVILANEGNAYDEFLNKLSEAQRALLETFAGANV